MRDKSAEFPMQINIDAAALISDRLVLRIDQQLLPQQSRILSVAYSWLHPGRTHFSGVVELSGTDCSDVAAIFE